MLAIKLARIGKRKHPFYRIIVVPKERDTYGRYIEAIGTYNPLVHPAHITLNKERASYWIKSGAQPTNTVSNIFIDQEVLHGAKKKTFASKKFDKKAVDTLAKPA